MRYKIYKFKNGATIIYKKRLIGNATAMYAGFFCGAMYEQNGLPHFFEHMLFQGTNKRSSDDIIKDRSAITLLNAATNHYYVAVNFYESNKRINKCFEYSSDVLLNSKFDQKYIDKEADVIIEETSSDISNLRKDIIRSHYYYIKNQYPTIEDYVNYWFGNKDFLKNLTVQNLLDFKEKHFLTDKFFVSVATTLPFYKIKRLVKKYFLSNIKTPIKPSEIIPFKYYPISQKQSINVIENNDNQIIKCMLSIKMNTGETNYRYDYNFNCISRSIAMRDDMFYNVCRKNGYIYSCDSYMYYSEYKPDIAYVFKFTTSKIENIEKIFSVIGDTIKILKTNGLTKDDVKSYIDSFYINEDKPTFTPFTSTAINQIYFYYKYGKEKRKSKKFIKKCVEKVNVNTVKENIEKCFNKNNDIHITFMGKINKEDLKSVEYYKDLIFID